MKINGITKQLTKFIMNLEVILAVCLMLGILIGIVDTLRHLSVIAQTDIADSYDVFKKFLGFVLLLVVGIELVLMLLSHSSRAVLQLVLFAIARKMLIYSETMLDLILGTAAIAGVFAIKKYLMTKGSYIHEEGTIEGGHIISAAETIEDISIHTGLHIPVKIGNTLGGVISSLSEDTSTPIEEGAQYEVGNIQMKIVEVKNGLIQTVLLKEKEINNPQEKEHTEIREKQGAH